MTTTHFKLSNLSCSSCVIHIEGLEDKIKGIKQIDVNFKKQTMVAEYDESQVNSDQIVKAVEQAGYSAREADDLPKKSFKFWKS